MRLGASRFSHLALLVVCFGCMDAPKTFQRGAANDTGGSGGMGDGGEPIASAGMGADVGGARSDDAGAPNVSDNENAAGDGGAAGETITPGDTGGTGGANSAGGSDSGGESVGGTSVGGAETASGGGGSDGRAATVVTVDFGATRQRMDGFGVATSWGVIPPAARLDAFFSVSKGAGLSIVRNRIPFRESPANNDNFLGAGNYTFTTTGTDADAYKTFTLNWNNWDLSATRKLIAAIKGNPDYQVPTYFSTPWTPPNNNTSRWKLGVADYVNAPEVGGYLDPAHYQDYADLLADYVLGFEGKMGAPLAALSLQNEPNYKVTYESADWSAEQFHSFLTVLKSEFTKKGVFYALPNFTIIAPEAENFKEDLILPTLADSNTAPLIGIVGGHQYEFGPWNVASYAPKPFSNSLAAGKKIWMTEWNTSAFKAETPLSSALLLARLIQADLTTASVSAYVHWWYKDLVDSDGVPNKNLWAIGQFSRFIRPGAVRLEMTNRIGTDLLLAAFKDAAGTGLTVVAINRATADATFAIELNSGTLGAVSSYRTSATEDLQDLGSTPSSGSFVNVTAPGHSISTFVTSVQP
jgi:O-glycosyl hydrolase